MTVALLGCLLLAALLTAAYIGIVRWLLAIERQRRYLLHYLHECALVWSSDATADYGAINRLREQLQGLMDD